MKKKLPHILLILTMITALTLLTASSSFAAFTNVKTGSRFMIVNESGYAVDNRDSNPRNGAVAQIYEPTMSLSEQWTFHINKYSNRFQIRNVRTGLYLETRNSRKENWAPVGLWSNAKIPCQYWGYRKVGSSYVLENLNSRKNLSVRGGDFKNGTTLIQHSNTSKAERFRFLEITDYERFASPVRIRVKSNVSTVGRRFGPDMTFGTVGAFRGGTLLDTDGKINGFYHLTKGGWVPANSVYLTEPYKIAESYSID